MKSPVRLVRLLFVVLLAILPLLSLGSAPAPRKGPAKKSLPKAVAVEVKFNDGSVLKLRLKDERLTLNTPYGKLLIPLADIHEIEIATRLPADIARKIKAAIFDLKGKDFKTREAAMNVLIDLGEKAYAALLDAEKDKDAEVRRRAQFALRKIRGANEEDDLKVRKHDVIHTALSRIAGTIEADTMKADTTQFGEVKMKLSDVRHIRSLDYKPPEPPMAVLADPMTLTAYSGQIGKVFAFRVVGRTIGGSVYGTKTHTLDSNLGMAAVHGGFLKNGQVGVVKVKILGPQVSFTGTVANGISSFTYGAYPGAFEILKK